MPGLIPDWRGVHHFIVHIPIILLSIAPLLVIVSMGIPAPRRRLFLGSALILMVLGTVTTFVAVTTGEAAMKSVGSSSALKVALAEHQALAETTMELFSVLTLAFTALVFAPRLLRRELDARMNTALLAIYLVLYATGALFLAHTALQGGQLVRELDAKTAAIYQLSGKESAR